MNNTRTTERSRRWLPATAALVALTLIAANCGDDGPDQDDASEDTETTESATGTAASTGTTEPTVTTEATGITEATGTTEAAGTTEVTTTSDLLGPFDPSELEECLRRPGELLATSDRGTDIAEILEQDPETVVEVPLQPDIGDAPNLGVSLYQFANDDLDPLEAAALIAASDDSIDAAPNYMSSFAPNWKYAPYDDPRPEDEPEDGAEDELPSAGGVGIAVLDTGFVDVANAPAQTTTNVVPIAVPPLPSELTSLSPPEEALVGRSAGHGTFIANILAQLLSDVTIYTAAIAPRFEEDDQFELNDGTIVSVRDDATLIWTISTLLGQEVPPQYINMSFGSYGCPGSPGDGPDEIYLPLGLRTVVDELAARAERGEAIEVFAAAGNDGHREGGPVFYPAGWAPDYEWLHSVASDPIPGDDYSNRGILGRVADRWELRSERAPRD